MRKESSSQHKRVSIKIQKEDWAVEAGHRLPFV